MSVFRVHFTWKGKDLELKACSLDMTHPYFVCIKDLLLPDGNSMVINPAYDEIRQRFAGVRQLMLPFQAVSLIEEFREDPDAKKQDTVSVDKKKTKGESSDSIRLLKKE